MRTKIRGVLFLLAAALVAPAAHAADAGVATSAGQLPDGFADTLSELARRGAAVQAMSVSNNGDWVVVSDRGVAASPGLPAPLRAAIDDAVRRGQPVEAVAQQGGRWTVVAGGQVSGDLPPDVRQQLLSSVSARRPVAAVALAPGSPDGWAVAAG
ncbi:MAG: hypothetical protein R3325_03175, partial [Thermoanaerobaculia bacterium]|nr:hypothetical protein [Thermoanaerobaculia bacterium]